MIKNLCFFCGFYCPPEYDGIIRKQELAYLIKMHETSGITGYVIIVEDRKVLNKLELSFILINITPPRPPS